MVIWKKTNLWSSFSGKNCTVPLENEFLRKWHIVQMLIIKVALLVFFWSSFYCVLKLFFSIEERKWNSLLHRPAALPQNHHWNSACVSSGSSFVTCSAVTGALWLLCIMGATLSRPPSFSFPFMLVCKHRRAHCQRAGRGFYIIFSLHGDRIYHVHFTEEETERLNKYPRL